MSKDHKTVQRILDEYEKIEGIKSIVKKFAPLSEKDILSLDNSKYSTEPSPEGWLDRLNYLKNKGFSVENITSDKSLGDSNKLKGNIENFIGMAQIPIGLAGPILINGSEASGDFFVPLATTEGALVASYNRGMKVCRMSGGISTACFLEGVQRSPYFKFENISAVIIFVKWVHSKIEVFKDIVSSSSNYAVLNEMGTNIEGNSVILTFEYNTGDAAGQNMVTICTSEICKYILQNFETPPVEWYIESNYSGDKKATARSFSNVRGKKVTSEIVIPRNIVKEGLKTTPEKMASYWRSSTLAVVQSGSIGAQGHIANGLTALFIACGQDVACISESSIGITRMETNSNEDLYVSLTLPSVIVGTVGGGTGLPTQQECLKMMGCAGEGKARKLAEICCAVALAGEISIAAAMSADHFTKAHQNLGRKKSE